MPQSIGLLDNRSLCLQNKFRWIYVVAALVVSLTSDTALYPSFSQDPNVLPKDSWPKSGGNLLIRTTLHSRKSNLFVANPSPTGPQPGKGGAKRPGEVPTAHAR